MRQKFTLIDTNLLKDTCSGIFYVRARIAGKLYFKSLRTGSENEARRALDDALTKMKLNNSLQRCLKGKDTVQSKETIRKGRTLLHSAKYRAKKHNLEFNLTIEDVNIPTHCPVLGIPLVINTHQKNCGPQDNSPTLDRIDNTKGYIKGNVIIVSWKVNRLKGDATLQEMTAITAFYTNLIKLGLIKSHANLSKAYFWAQKHRSGNCSWKVHTGKTYAGKPILQTFHSEIEAIAFCKYWNDAYWDSRLMTSTSCRSSLNSELPKEAVGLSNENTGVAGRAEINQTRRMDEYGQCATDHSCPTTSPAGIVSQDGVSVAQVSNQVT